MKMMPFFTFYGGKHRATKHYPIPAHDTIIEPFCGSAGFSLNYPARRILINDLDPIVAGTWQYLIDVRESEILGLPDVGKGETVDDFNLPQEAKWLIGWWLNKGSATPKKAPSSFMLNYPAGAPYWGESIRARIASQLDGIRHWRATNGSYEDIADRAATWFIDPPYQRMGKHYRFDSAGLDYAALAAWCRSRNGQAIVCEADDADWLPFAPLVAMDSNEGGQKKNRAKMEVLWTRDTWGLLDGEKQQ